MKNRIFKSILVLLLFFVAMPVMGQDYLTIKLKDGKEVRHLLALVNEMSTSKYDADGVMYSDYAFQLVSMRDTVYYYAIEDIESISFKSVDQEQIKENTESALSSVVSVLEDLESFDDIKNRSDEIAHAEGVEKVDVHDKAIVVRIKDWRDIVILDTPDKGNIPSGLSAKQRMPRYVMPIISKSPKINNSVRVAIADQNAKNEAQGYVNSTNVLLEIKNHFSQLGYDVKYIPQPSLDFFREDIFKNDVIMLTTHGFYLDGKHWFATGEEIGEATQSWLNSKLDSEDFWGKDNFELYYNYIDYDIDLDYVRLSYIPETRGGKKKWILYTICSEDYIGNSPFKFEKGDAVIFANVCESLTDNHSVAEMFHRKGTAAYLGYEGTTYYGEYAGGIFFSYQMLNGASAAYAYGKIPDNEKVESDKEGAILRYLPNPKNSSNPKFITKTITAPSSEVKDEIIEGNTHAVTLYGYATMRENTGEVKMAFQISQDENMENAQTVLCNANYSETDNQNGNIKFWGSVEAEPGNTYYYRAYTYDDGMNPNYGEICSFTIEATKKLIKVEPTEIDFGEVEVGSSKSATFTVSNVGTASLTVTVASGLDEGDDCVLPGSGQQFTLAAGQSKTFTVTYTPTQENSGFNAIVRILSDAENGTEIVTVSGRSYKAADDDIVAYTSCPDSHHPHLIDLGLSSGTKWACCNVGAQNPEDYGGYFAWGETTEKSSYTERNYLDGKGTSYDIGKDIAGTQYDAATANWGSPWVMPNKEQMEELKNNCTSEWTTENGVNGRRFTGTNGASIFLPAAGGRYEDIVNAGSYGSYWSSTLYESDTDDAWDLYFRSGSVNAKDNYWRHRGLSVRPVRKN